MIVLDASVVVELLTNGILADSIRSELAGRDESVIVPHLIDVEAMSALRRLVARQRIDSHRSRQFLAELVGKTVIDSGKASRPIAYPNRTGRAELHPLGWKLSQTSFLKCRKQGWFDKTSCRKAKRVLPHSSVRMHTEQVVSGRIWLLEQMNVRSGRE
jgi:hypothetical protein